MSIDTATGDNRSIDEVTERVMAKFPAQRSASVRDLVARAHGQYAQSRIRDFVPVLVEREVVEHLRLTATGT
ncbi:MAG: hypothetical protein JWR42_250 [Marmoricola sp.]|jgi:hypothetical protein|nr:hypothetical protein [Marmoricola sp.]